MVIPGFSTSRVPMRIRLYIAISITLSLTPLLLDTVEESLLKSGSSRITLLIVSEISKGLLIGLMGRMFMLSIQFSASTIAMFIGMGAMPGTPIEGQEAVPALVSLITVTATALVFFTDLHLEIIYALLGSYDVSPVGQWPQMKMQLNDIVRNLSKAMFVSIQASAPFFIYAVLVNLAIGLANKLTPQIPIYFISLPFVLLGGLMLLFIVSDEMLILFMQGFRDWLLNG